jgi:hypothetical protein
MAGSTVPLCDVNEDGFPALVPISVFVHTPAASLVAAEFVAPCDLDIVRLEVHPGDCGSADATTVDITDDGASLFTVTPSIANTAVNGTRVVYYPDSDMIAVDADSVVSLLFGTVATAAADFGLTVFVQTRSPQ